jgi:IS5 family transposase
MGHQIPLSAFSGVYADLTNPGNDLLGFFAQVDLAAVNTVLARYYSGRGPEGYGAARYLALLLRVKQNIVSDRRLVADLTCNELYRRAIGLDADPATVPKRSALSAFRARLGPDGFWALHRAFVLRAHAAGLGEPDLPQLPRNRRPGLILIVDGTFLRAYAHQHAKTDADGTKRFTDPSVTYGRRHPIYRYPVGHKAHSLVTVGGLPLVSITAPANELDQTHLLALLERFRSLYPDLEVAYLLLDKGYDVDALYQAVYEDYGIIPVACRKSNIAYPEGFSARGRPLCPYGIELARRGTDHARRRTKFCCEHRCRHPDTEPDPSWQDCAHLTRSGAGYTFYTRFDWSYRKFGPLTPDMGLFDKLYRLRTDVERGFGLTKANRYRMEQSITVMGLDAVSIHVTLHDTAVVIDALQRGRPPLRPGQVTPTP